MITDANRNVIWRARNFAFDRTVVQANAVPLNLGFPGQIFDPESGLWYNGARYYSAVLGRYIQSDPVGLLAGINTYVYVGGNPLSRVDPLGLWAFSVQAYLGAGGGVNVSWANGTLELTGQIGVGIGGGLAWDPKGKPSPHAKGCGSGLIARTTLNASAGIGYGPLSAGGSYVNAGENVFDPTPKRDVMDWGTGGYSSRSVTTIGVDNTPMTSGFGVRYGVSLSAEAGSYSNW